jgi:uncharacterized protein YwgA
MMNNISKFMVVPYVKPIERPADSRVQELDNEMTLTLSDPQLGIEEKIRRYGQALARFQTHFDPNTYNESPTSLDMADTIKTIAEEAVIAKVDRGKKEEADASFNSKIVQVINETSGDREAANVKSTQNIVDLINAHRAEKQSADEAFTNNIIEAIKSNPAQIHIMPSVKKATIKKTPTTKTASLKAKTGKKLTLENPDDGDQYQSASKSDPPVTAKITDAPVRVKTRSQSKIQQASGHFWLTKRFF